MTTIRMEFWREPHGDKGCIEYSYVPEGRRRNIVLPPGVQEGYSDDVVPDGTRPSHVQVYVATTGMPPASLEMWQFPPGPPYHLPIKRARVELHGRRGVAVGIVWYEDGHEARDEHPLEPIPRDCPTGY